MVQISVFQISQDASELKIIASTGIDDTITTVRLWTQDTFKDYSQAIDVTNKLLGTNNTESLTVTAMEMGVNTLDGIYFVELVDSTAPASCAGCNNTSLAVAADFSRFQYCIIEYLCKLDSCLNCNSELNKALTLKLYIDGMRNSLQLGNFTTAIKFWKNLDRACSKSCTECGTLSYIAKKGLGFQTLNDQLILY